MTETGSNHFDAVTAIVEVLTKRMFQGVGCGFVFGQVGGLGMLLEQLVDADAHVSRSIELSHFSLQWADYKPIQQEACANK